MPLLRTSHYTRVLNKKSVNRVNTIIISADIICIQLAWLILKCKRLLTNSVFQFIKNLHICWLTKDSVLVIQASLTVDSFSHIINTVVENFTNLSIWTRH